jgi:3-oxoacyl-[acyl-carrier protein] reductase
MGNILSGKVAVISGSGQGIGRTIAKAMAKEGALVVTNNRFPGSPGGDAETTAREIVDKGGQAIAFFGDVSKFGAAQGLIKTALNNFGRLDILINNAGVIARNWVWDITEEDWDKCVDASLKSSFNCIRHSCNIMREQGWGRIINTTSPAWQGTLGGCDYSAAKAGIVALTKCVALEMGSYGVTCNAYAPVAATRMTTSEEAKAWNKMRYEKGVHTKDANRSLLNPSHPETVVSLILYLCTDKAADINGQVFRVRGSHIAIYSVPEEKNPIDKKGGLWTVEELIELIPKIVLKDTENPAPAQTDK